MKKKTVKGNIAQKQVSDVKFLNIFAANNLLEFSDEFQNDNLTVTKDKKTYTGINQERAIVSLKEEYNSLPALAQEYINALSVILAKNNKTLRIEQYPEVIDEENNKQPYRQETYAHDQNCAKICPDNTQINCNYKKIAPRKDTTLALIAHEFSHAVDSINNHSSIDKNLQFLCFSQQKMSNKDIQTIMNCTADAIDTHSILKGNHIKPLFETPDLPNGKNMSLQDSFKQWEKDAYNKQTKIFDLDYNNGQYQTDGLNLGEYLGYHNQFVFNTLKKSQNLEEFKAKYEEQIKNNISLYSQDIKQHAMKLLKASISDFIVIIKKEQSLDNDLAQCLDAMPAILDKIAIESPSMKLKRAQALQKINYNPKKKVKQQIDNPQEETKEAQDEYSGKSDNSNDERNPKPSGKVYKGTDTKIQNKSKQVKIRPSLSKAHDVQLSSQQQQIVVSKQQQKTKQQFSVSINPIQSKPQENSIKQEYQLTEKMYKFNQQQGNGTLASNNATHAQNDEFIQKAQDIKEALQKQPEVSQQYITNTQQREQNKKRNQQSNIFP